MNNKVSTRMTIKELMSQVDVNRVTDAFLLLDYNFSVENYENSFIEKYEAIPRIRKIIEENVRLFAECTTNDVIEQYTVFIMYDQDDEDYENQWKKEFSCFATSDGEVFSVIDKDFHIFDDEGDVTISRYSFGHTPMQEMSNYVISQSSLNDLGKEICAAKILSELFFWGAFPKEREKRVNELYEKLNKPIDMSKIVDNKTFKDRMKKWEEQLILNMSNDEKAYHFAKKSFDKETEDIVQRYRYRVINEIQKKYIDAIKTEYKGR